MLKDAREAAGVGGRVRVVHTLPARLRASRCHVQICTAEASECDCKTNQDAGANGARSDRVRVRRRWRKKEAGGREGRERRRRERHLFHPTKQ